MSVRIDEITASVEPPEPPSRLPEAREEDSGKDHPVIRLRRERDLLCRIETRTRRLRAD